VTVKKNLTFENALGRLEEIVAKLESGEITLDESVKAFEEGKELVRFCLGRLEQAEKKVQKLEEKSDGSFEVSPM